MTPVPVQVEGSPAAVFAEALRSLSRLSMVGGLIILLGWVSLVFATARWFLLLSELGSPAVGLSTSWLLLMVGASALLHATQLLLAPGAVVPQPPALASRARRLGRVAAVELGVYAAIAVILGVLDAVSGGAVARLVAHQLLWRPTLWGGPSPIILWLVAWASHCLIHTFALSWLWPALAANYPGATLKATFRLAVGAGVGTPWLASATLGSVIGLAALSFWLASAAALALVALTVWPAVANTAAARVRPTTSD